MTSDSPSKSKAVVSKALAGLGLVVIVVTGLASAPSLRGCSSDEEPEGPAAAPSGPVWKPIAVALERAGRGELAKSLTEVCRAPSCGCSMKAASFALDHDLPMTARALSEGLSVCGDAEKVTLRAMRIEQDVRSNRPGARAVAEQFVVADPTNPFGLQALALAEYREGKPADALRHAAAAVRAKRGTPALLLEGLAAYQLGKLELAKETFERLLQLEPRHVDAVYNLALIAQVRGRYLRAREGYLKALRLRPQHPDARFNLGVLAHSVGAQQEAEHHLTELEASEPGGDYVAKLTAILGKPPEQKKPKVVLTPGPDAGN